MLRLPLTALALLSCLACQTSGPALRDANPEQREALFAPVRTLEGTWTLQSDEQPGEITFAVTSNGSAVRELMFPGSPLEMTNMYTLDGNSLIMTHYCSNGSQSTMRANTIDGDRIVFVPESVNDLQAGYDHYMSGMTLVLVDKNTIEQQWVSYYEETGETGTVAFTLNRNTESH